ncbi:MAG: hypothetical protein JW838_08760 [Spirochaetes bacterium]|nr:hypothetical protein [Spirochaetota bacterium]
MKMRAGQIMLAAILFAGAAVLTTAKPLKTEKNDYSILEGTWVDLKTNEFTGVIAHFKPKGEYAEYIFYDKDEKLVQGEQPKTLVWTGHGTYSVSYDVLVIRMTSTSDNLPPFNKSFHFVRFGKCEMELLNTAGGERTVWKKVE